MSDLVKPTSEEIGHIKTYFRDKYGVLLTTEEAKEIYLSLYYLGKALYRYKNLAREVIND